MKKLLILIPILILISPGCNMTGKTNPQSAENVRNRKEKIPEELANIKQPEPLTYERLKESVEGRLGWMLEEGMVNKKDYEILKSAMLNDIDTFLKGSQSKEQLTERACKSLARLKAIPLESEDREFVAETYYDIAKRCDIDIAKDLNKWLYGIDF